MILKLIMMKAIDSKMMLSSKEIYHDHNLNWEHHMTMKNKEDSGF